MLRRTLTAALLVHAAAWSDSASMVQLDLLKSRRGAENATAAFVMSELVEVKDAFSDKRHLGHVVGRGKQADTFNIAILHQQGIVEGVKSAYLRHKWAYRKGDIVEVYDPKTDQWSPGIVGRNGTGLDSYDVAVPIRSGVVPSVHVSYTREAPRFTSLDLVEIMVPSAGKNWTTGTIVGDGAKPGTYDINAHEKGLLKGVSQVFVRRAATISPGDLVDIYDPVRGKIVNESTVLYPDKQPGTFHLIHQEFGEMDNVSIENVRRAVMHGDTVIGSDLQKGELVEYLDQITGSWIPAVAQDNSTRPDSYVVEAPIVGKTFDIHVASLRRAEKLRKGDLSEILDEKTGVWEIGMVEGDGRLPYTVNITVPTLGFLPDVPINTVRHWVKPQTGEAMEVYDRNAKRWYPCRIIGPGKFVEGTYNLAVPMVGGAPDVSPETFRRVAKPKLGSWS